MVFLCVWMAAVSIYLNAFHISAVLHPCEDARTQAQWSAHPQVGRKMEVVTLKEVISFLRVKG